MQEPAGPSLSVVMPVYDEEAGIADAVHEVQRHVLDAVPASELVVVDDGSTDGTRGILRGLAAADPRIRVVERANGGHGPALVSGLDAARGARILLIDSDRQIPLDCFPELWRRAADCDALLGVRAARRDPLLRRALSRAMRAGIALLFGVRVRDAGAPFKILDAALWERIRPRLGTDCPIPAVLLAVHASASGARVEQHPVPHRAREHGASKLRGLGLARFCLRSAGALLALRFAPP